MRLCLGVSNEPKTKAVKRGLESMKIAHLTSAHPRYDTRIFLKMCRSVAAAGYDVFLVVADGKGDEDREGVCIMDVGPPRGRLDRMWGASRRVFHKAVALDADLYHLHDPELLPVGLALKRRGKRVIFDSHEDVPRDILSKYYLHPALRRIIAVTFGWFERFAGRKLDHVVAATPSIRDKFSTMGIATTDINNFPMLGELEADVLWAEKKPHVCYVGSITSIRGIPQLVSAIALCKSGALLEIGGKFDEAGLREKLIALPGWERVIELGYLGRTEMRELLSRTMVGLVTFLPEPNHVDAQPNKMFEYMSAGMPLIASDFPLWREIVNGSECGLCVDPLSPDAIAAAIDQLVDNPDLARRMGENGRRAVHERYNWAIEEKKLLALYDELISKNGPIA